MSQFVWITQLWLSWVTLALRLQAGCQPRLWSPQGSTRGRFASTRTHVVVDRIHFLSDHWQGTSLISVLYWSLRRAAHNVELGFFRVTKRENRNQFFCNLIPKVTSCHFRCILVVRNKSLGSAHTMGRGLHRAKIPGGKAIGSHLRSCYHSS